MDSFQPPAITSTINHSIFPEEVFKLMAAIPENYFWLEEAELLDLMPGENVKSSERRLKISFWHEYDRVLSGVHDISKHQVMSSARVTHGVMGIAAYKEFIRNPVKLAWLLMPPANYKVCIDELHYAGIERVREILALPIKDKKGIPNPATARLVLKAFELLDLRAKGSIVQRSMNVSVNVDKQADTAAAADKINSIDQQIAELLGEPQPIKRPADIQIGVVKIYDQCSEPGPAQEASRKTAGDWREDHSQGRPDDSEADR